MRGEGVQYNELTVSMFYNTNFFMKFIVTITLLWVQFSYLERTEAVWIM